ncbi:Tbc1 Domain Family Member 5 [Manis pentadactyla]|nr:Tbc1 Domain Family Member 5 [Manis pentadactyla]
MATGSARRGKEGQGHGAALASWFSHGAKDTQKSVCKVSSHMMNLGLKEISLALPSTGVGGLLQRCSTRDSSSSTRYHRNMVT